jgi:antitoxin component YwqK of YwqJK toxin-antitoxin module
MSTARVITGIWRKHEETKENPKESSLKTRYYRKSRESLINDIKKIVQNGKFAGWALLNEDVARGEIMLEKGAYGMVITIYNITPMQSAIDVYCSKEGMLGDFGNSYRYILEFFKALRTEAEPES